jgi:hypothetical protein
VSTRETRQNSKLGWTPEAQAAIMDYPILGTIRHSKDVLTVARILDALSEADRNLAITKLKNAIKTCSPRLPKSRRCPDVK